MRTYATEAGYGPRLVRKSRPIRLLQPSKHGGSTRKTRDREPSRVTSALLVGSIPGAYIGAKLSTRLSGALIRRALAFVLLASALKLLGVGTALTAALLLAVAVLAGPVWMLLRKRHGFPAVPRHEPAVQAAQLDQVAA